MSKQQRSDAVRNRTRILETAHAQLTAVGPEVSMGEIARAAGVAVGTLYRHFPTKADLVAATLEQHLVTLTDELRAAATRVADGASAAEEVRELLRASVHSQADSRILKETARSLDLTDAGEALGALDEALSRLLELGTAAGEIRPGTTTADIYLLMSTMPTEESEAARLRWAELVVPGIVRDSA
ncbi:helix-turn-helix domain-containing protein [Georgenia phoenicis]|uniref:TetR/AcrR family transcriptional regulator n=1 Tax=unclassified Georgenia TaxID=2626815 RepID=UPI0039B0CFC3